VRYSLW